MSLTTTGGNALVPQSMDQAVKLAEMMSRAKMVPGHLQGHPGDCLMVIEQAGRWGMSPFAVAQCTSVIQGKLMYEGKLVAAALHTSGALKTRLEYTYAGEGADRVVTVSAVLSGEDKPRTVPVRLADAKTTNKVWTTQPDQQLAYAGARVWARRYCPEVMLGVYAPEEMEGKTFEGVAEVVRNPPPARTIEASPAPKPPPTPEEWARDLVATFDAADTYEKVQALVGDFDIADNMARAEKARPDLYAMLETAKQRAMDRVIPPTAHAPGADAVDGEMPA